MKHCPSALGPSLGRALALEVVLEPAESLRHGSVAIGNLRARLFAHYHVSRKRVLNSSRELRLNVGTREAKARLSTGQSMRTMRYPRPRREYRLQATVHARGAHCVGQTITNDIFGPCEHVLCVVESEAGG